VARREARRWREWRAQHRYCRSEGGKQKRQHKAGVIGIAASIPEIYKSQIPVVEQALETAALMLGSDRSRGYCLEMICADFLAGENLDSGNPEILLYSLRQFLKFLPEDKKQQFLATANEKTA
jgi:hypothetical protein